MSTKGKVGTKGQKQIHEENKATVLGYASASAVGIVASLLLLAFKTARCTNFEAFHAVIWLLLFNEPPSTWHKVG